MKILIFIVEPATMLPFPSFRYKITVVSYSAIMEYHWLSISVGQYTSI